MSQLATSTLVALTAAILITGGAEAQTSRFSLEPRAGASFPVDDEALRTGYTIGGEAIFQASRVLGVYAGYNFNSYKVDLDPFEGGAQGLTVRAEVKGFTTGVRATFAAGRLHPFFKAGLLVQSFGINVSGSEGEGSFSRQGDNEVGFEVGGGAEFPLTPRFSLTPGASYNNVGPAEYVRADVGLRIRL